MTANESFGQEQDKIENFLSYFEENYESSKLDSEYQYFRQLKTLRNKSIWNKALKFKSKETFSNENSYYYDPHQRIQFYIFKYKNILICDSSFNKLLDCFPNTCIKVEKGQDISYKITPSIYIANKTQIICIRTRCEDVNERWNEVVLKAVNTFATEKSTIIWTKCGKLIWTTKEKLINGL